MQIYKKPLKYSSFFFVKLACRYIVNDCWNNAALQNAHYSSTFSKNKELLNAMHDVILQTFYFKFFAFIKIYKVKNFEYLFQ